MLAELPHQLTRNFPKPHAARAPELDELGTKLWNASINLRQANANIPCMLQLRVFAFCLLHLAQTAIHKSSQEPSANHVRVLRIGLKAGKACIDGGKTDLATYVFEKSAEYVEVDHGGSDSKTWRPVGRDDYHAAQSDTLEDLRAEYYLLRASLCWKLDRTDTVKYWLGKVRIRAESETSNSLAEKKADLLYEIGKTALRKKQYQLAVDWLKESAEVLDVIEEESLNPDCYELRIAITSDTVRALIGLKDAASLQRASILVGSLQAVSPSCHQCVPQLIRLQSDPEFKMSTCILELNVFAARASMPAEQFLEGTLSGFIWRLY